MSFFSDAEPISYANILILLTLEYILKRNFSASNARQIYIMEGRLSRGNEKKFNGLKFKEKRRKGFYSTSFNEKVTGRVYRTLTFFPEFCPGIQLGIVAATRIASASKTG